MILYSVGLSLRGLYLSFKQSKNGKVIKEGSRRAGLGASAATF